MKKLFPYLTYAGALPFLFCAYGLSFDVAPLPYAPSFEEIVSVYGLVIAAFMAGAHWGQHLSVNGFWAKALPIVSNIIALSLWVGFLYLSFPALMAILVCTFMVLLGVDSFLWKQGVIPHEYFKVRCIVTVLVVVSLIISGMST